MAGKVIILCAPSGSGKTTLAKYLLSIKELDLKFSVSATTRKKRDGEKDGLDYNFLSWVIYFHQSKQGKVFFSVFLLLFSLPINWLEEYQFFLFP